MKLAFFQVLIVCVFCSFHQYKDGLKHKVKTIVIDPGHGGRLLL